MSVVPMKRIFLCALKRDRKGILEFLQRESAVELNYLDEDDDVFRKQDMSKETAQFRRNAQTAENALKILDLYAPEKGGLSGLFAGRDQIDKHELGARIEARDADMKLCFRTVRLEKELAETKAAIPKLQDQVLQLTPWADYDLPLSLTETEKTAIITGVLEGEVPLEDIYSGIAKSAPDAEVDVTIVSSTEQQTCFFLVTKKEDRQRVTEALQKMNYSKPPIYRTNPAGQISRLNEEIKADQEKEQQILDEIKELATHREQIRFASDYYTIRADKYQVISELEQSNKTFLIEGYVPEPKAEALKAALEKKFTLEVDLADPDESDDPPVLLKNNAFADPVQGVTESFALPAKGEFDPTFVSALFYYLLFGIMLSDAGYGLILIIGTFILLRKFPNMEEGTKRMMKLMFGCGWGTVFAGLMTGSFFGNTVNVVATTFFNRPDITFAPLMFDPLTQPMRMMAICFAIGIVHMFVGLAVKAYTLIRNGKPLDVLYDVIFWYLLLIGCIILLLTSENFSGILAMKEPLSAIYQTPAKVMAIIGAIGIILFGDRSSKNPVKRIMKGLYALYGISGWLSDVLSYSRLLALGLATGVIAQVFNKMGTMAGGGVLGAIIFIVIFLIGQVLNLAINALGAYVHTNRLTYVEFFGKFYDGGGRKFKPFKADTKYFKIKEEL